MTPITLNIKTKGLDEIKHKAQKIQSLVDQLNAELKEMAEIEASIQL
jgi:hypothetical protein